MELEIVTVSDRLADILDRMLLQHRQRFQSAEAVILPTKKTTASHASKSPARFCLPQQQPHRHRQSLGDRHTLELLAGAAFSGFEGGLIATRFQSTATG